MFSCKACSPSDPATATVKVNPTMLDGANKENVNSQQSIAEKEKQQREREARERKEKEEQERRQARTQEQERREAARKAAELRRQQEEELEFERRRAEEAFQEQRRREEEERRFREEEQRQEEARKREQREQEQREKEKREQEQKAADMEKLQAFLRSKGYGDDVNGKRKTLRKYFFPLHDAIAAGDADLVRVLLAAGADPTLPSSSGKTPLERAEKWNKNGSLDQVCELLTQAERK